MLQVAPREKEGSNTLPFRFERGTYSAHSVADDSSWVLPQLAGGHLLNLPLPREIGSDSNAALDLPVPTYTTKESIKASGNPCAHCNNL